jgi:peroxiredoxin Q/BCP
MALKKGEKAPDFKVKDQNGNTVQLSDFVGKKVVLYFYPKDDTPGCTAQACNLRDNYEQLLSAGFIVLGVSTDDENSHQKFIQKYNLPFPLLADTEKQMVNDYGVWVEKNMYGKKYWGIARTTFVIDENGTISEVIAKVKTDDHTAQIMGK